jgi:hemolysin activation/secretion protein
MNGLKAWICILYSGLTLGLSLPVKAQMSDPVAAATRTHEQRLQQEALRQRQEMQEQQHTQDIFLQPDVETLGQESPAGQRCFDINVISVQGVTAIADSDIAGITKKYLSKCLSIDGINNLVKEISNLYLAHGWVTSRAFIKPQNLSNGSLEILVVEGKLEAVESADGNFSERQLRWAFPVEQKQLLDLRDLEQGLEQINRLQQNRAQMDIQPGSEIGQSKVIIHNRQQKSWRAGAGVNNSGSEATGEILATAYASWDNPLDINDNLFINLSDTLDKQEQAVSRSYALAYSVPYGYALFSYSGNYFEYQQQVDGASITFLTSGSSVNHMLGSDYLVYRGQRDKLSIGLSFTHKQSKNYIEDVFLDTSSRVLSVWELGATYTRLLRGGVFHTAVNWHSSVDWLDAKTKVVQAENDYQFNKYTLDSSFNHHLGQVFSFQSSLHLFYSPEDIIASEGLSLGGRYSVRGVEGSNLLGYRGGYWRNQVGYETVFKFNALAEFFIGIDYGESDTPEYDDEGRAQLSGAVVGAKFSSTYFNADITYAQALQTPEFLHSDDYGVYVSAQVNF